MINYQLSKLNNGLTVITAPMNQTKAVTVLVMVKVGSRYESEQENGISHFLEHMFFKGTKRRPTSLHISRELDAIGAEFNAFTAEEFTGFYISSSADHFAICLDILSDMLVNSLFDKKEIEKEKGVILEEINMYKDLPHKYVLDLAKYQFFGDTPLGRQVVGQIETVKNFQQKDFFNYFGRHYSGSNCYVAIAGNPLNFDWQKAVEKKLGQLAKGQENVFAKKQFQQNSLKINLHYKKTDQAHLVLGFKGIDRFDPRRFSLSVLNNLLGGIMSSRLFTEVREKRGLAYYVGSSNWEFSDQGAVFAQAGLDIKRIDEAIKIIIDEFAKLKKINVLDEEIIRSKENIKGRTYLSLEESFAIAEFLADQELLRGQIRQSEEIIEDIFAVGKNNLQNIAYDLFVKEHLNLTIIGPFKDQRRFEKLLEI